MPESTNLKRARAFLRWTLAIAYFAAGVVHLRSPQGFMPIMPEWVPWPRTVILSTGVLELLGAIALCVPRLRRLAGVMLATYAVCVFPANIKHALNHIPVAGIQLSWWYHAPRLALQPVIVWSALFASGVVDWPWARKLGVASKDDQRESQL